MFGARGEVPTEVPGASGAVPGSAGINRIGGRSLLRVVTAGSDCVVVAVVGAVAVVVVSLGVATLVVASPDAATLVVASLVVASLGMASDVVVGEAALVVVVVVTGGAQVGAVTVFVSRVTAPSIAIRRPSTVAWVVAVMEVCANRFPRNTEFVPSVAELPTCQKILQACAPLINATVLEEDVIRVDPAWKTKTALGSPFASRVTVPDSAIEDPEL